MILCRVVVEALAVGLKFVWDPCQAGVWRDPGVLDVKARSCRLKNVRAIWKAVYVECFVGLVRNMTRLRFQ